MWRGGVAGLGLTLAALAACGDDEDSGATPDTSPSVQASPTADATAPAGGERTNRQWALVSVEGKDLTIRVDRRPCETDPQVNTAELDSSVTIETYAYVAGEDCKQTPRDQWEEVDIALRAPLGSRDLIGCEPTDGSIDCRTGKVRSRPAATAGP